MKWVTNMSVNQCRCLLQSLHHLQVRVQAVLLPKVKKAKKSIRSKRDREKGRKRNQFQSDQDLTVVVEKRIKEQFIHFQKKKDLLETCQIEIFL